jgi:hypothetical protein
MLHVASISLLQNALPGNTTDSSKCQFTLQTFRDICKLWGVPVAEDKTVEPTEILAFLGIEFDTLAMELRLLFWPTFFRPFSLKINTKPSVLTTSAVGEQF